VRRVVQEAADLGVPRLYLFTPDREQFYAHMGWVVHERTHYLDRPVVIMAIEPRAVC
jgi:N-acetylglutamate synthase-like GNAT family acetyltransferase